MEARIGPASVTVAPGITAPDSSMMVPERLPVWACAGAASASAIPRASNRRVIQCLLDEREKRRERNVTGQANTSCKSEKNLDGDSGRDAGSSASARAKKSWHRGGASTSG